MACILYVQYLVHLITNALVFKCEMSNAVKHKCINNVEEK